MNRKGKNPRVNPRFLARMSEWLEVSSGEIQKVKGRTGLEGKIKASV